MLEPYSEHLDYITKYSYNLSSYGTDVICILMCLHLAKRLVILLTESIFCNMLIILIYWKTTFCKGYDPNFANRGHINI